MIGSAASGLGKGIKGMKKGAKKGGGASQLIKDDDDGTEMIDTSGRRR